MVASFSASPLLSEVLHSSPSFIPFPVIQRHSPSSDPSGQGSPGSAASTANGLLEAFPELVLSPDAKRKRSLVSCYGLPSTAFSVVLALLWEGISLLATSLTLPIFCFIAATPAVPRDPLLTCGKVRKTRRHKTPRSQKEEEAGLPASTDLP